MLPYVVHERFWNAKRLRSFVAAHYLHIIVLLHVLDAAISYHHLHTLQGKKDYKVVHEYLRYELTGRKGLRVFTFKGTANLVSPNVSVCYLLGISRSNRGVIIIFM